jgi:DMSO/TMAO reductase YedYZ molybdopterin-dependent catalytic subunit
MKMARLFAICVIFQIAAWAQQNGAAILEVGGDVSHPHVYQEQEWKQLKHTSIPSTNAHEKKTSTFSGVSLRDLLKEAGVPSGENLRGKALATCVVVTANDGYQVTFSIAELDEGIGNLQVLVADSEDGKSLSPTAGPLRLVVPGDKRPARWVRMVKTIRVVASPSAASPQ